MSEYKYIPRSSLSPVRRAELLTESVIPDLFDGLDGPSSCDPYPPRSGPSLACHLPLPPFIFLVEAGVDHGLGGIDTYALLIIRLGVGVTWLYDIFENELEFVLGVRGTEGRGVTFVGEGMGNAFADCMRLDGDSINTIGLRFLGVTENADERSEYSARGSGLSSGGGNFGFGGGVTGRALGTGAGTGFICCSLRSRKSSKNAWDSCGW